MDVDKNTKRDVTEVNKGIIVNEVETRVVNLSDEDLLILSKKWEEKETQLDIETSEGVLSHLQEEMGFLNKVGEALTPFFKQDTNNVPPNILPIQSAINNLVQSYAERVKQIEHALMPEVIKQTKKLQEEHKENIEFFKPYINKAKLKLKIEEKKKERASK